MTDKKHTINDLFSDSGPCDESEVVRALHPHITIQKSSNLIFFKDTCLSTRQKILAYGLAKKLLKWKGLIDSETITAQEIYEKTGIKKGTIDPTFKALREERLLVGKREYEISAYKVQQIIQMLNSNSKI